jgi:hypothetical protein
MCVCNRTCLVNFPTYSIGIQLTTTQLAATIRWPPKSVTLVYTLFVICSTTRVLSTQGANGKYLSLERL